MKDDDGEKEMEKEIEKKNQKKLKNQSIFANLKIWNFYWIQIKRKQPKSKSKSIQIRTEKKTIIMNHEPSTTNNTQQTTSKELHTSNKWFNKTSKYLLILIIDPTTLTSIIDFLFCLLFVTMTTNWILLVNKLCIFIIYFLFIFLFN